MNNGTSSGLCSFLGDLALGVGTVTPENEEDKNPNPNALSGDSKSVRRDLGACEHAMD